MTASLAISDARGFLHHAAGHYLLQRSKATIYREIKRNWFSDECLPGYDGYYGAAAHQKAANRRARQRKLI
ncbi:hypothetical protein ACGYLN_17180, partial [Sulfitobacter sp. 1A09044]